VTELTGRVVIVPDADTDADAAVAEMVSELFPA
jgi:hypothetical protein